MPRPSLNYALAAMLAAAFLGLAFTGAQMGFVIPADIHALWGVSHRWWTRVHLFIALAFMLFVILHFGLHWGWLCGISRRTTLRSIGTWSAVVVATATLVVYAGLRSAPARWRITAETGLGRRVFLARECDLCHRINGLGGTDGPDLSHVGSKRTRASLRAEITDPALHQPGTKMPAHELPRRQLDALVGYLAGLK